MASGSRRHPYQSSLYVIQYPATSYPSAWPSCVLALSLVLLSHGHKIVATVTSITILIKFKTGRKVLGKGGMSFLLELFQSGKEIFPTIFLEGFSSHLIDQNWPRVCSTLQRGLGSAF